MKNIFKRTLYGLLPLAAVLSFLGYQHYSKQAPESQIPEPPRRPKSIPVQGIIAVSTANTQGITAMGTLLPNEEVDLVAEITGKVEGIFFQEGALVRKGDLLLKVNDDDLQAQLSRAEYQQKLLAERLQRQRILLERESVSREEFDQVQTDYHVLQADIDLLKVKISRTEIRAPFDGTMGFRYVSEGSYVQPNSTIARIVDDGSLKFEFSIPERYADKSLKGQSVRFGVTGRKTQYKASIYAVDPRVDVNTRAIRLRARYENTKRDLLPGMFAHGQLQLEANQQFIPVPTQAVVPEMEGKRLWVVRQGRATSIAVETEDRDQRNVAVISGIVPGDTILTSGLMQLREGASVQVSL